MGIGTPRSQSRMPRPIFRISQRVFLQCSVLEGVPAQRNQMRCRENVRKTGVDREDVKQVVVFPSLGAGLLNSFNQGALGLLLLMRCAGAFPYRFSILAIELNVSPFLLEMRCGSHPHRHGLRPPSL